MPALLFMGRRWGVGGDEFALPSLCSMGLRIVWSVALVVILVEVGADLSGCSDNWLLYSYFTCSLSTFALAVVVEWGIARVSTRGSIADIEPRASLGKYLNAHMLLGFFQIIMACVGLGLLTYLRSTCRGLLKDQALHVLLAVIVASQIMDVLVTCCCCALMRGNPQEIATGEDDGGGYYERFPPTVIEGQWESRCQWLYRCLIHLTCGLFGGQGAANEGDFKQLARVMARIFHTEEYLDVVPSDIAAGIVLLYHKQRQRWRGSWSTGLLNGGNGNVRSRESSSEISSDCGSDEARVSGGVARVVDGGLPPCVGARSVEHTKFHRVARRRVLDVTNPHDRQALEEVEHFSRYALAIYTWYLYVFERPCCGACDLLCYSCSGRSRAFHKSRNSSAKSFEQQSTASLSSLNSSQYPSERSGVSSRGAGEAGAGATSAEASEAEVAHAAGKAEAPSSRGYESEPEANTPVTVSVRGDNWLGTHEAGLLRVAGLHRGCEVIDAHFKSGIKATPYCIMVDHVWRCVVISIRGTMSLDDCLTDLQAEPTSMSEAGRRWGFDGTDMYAHQGVLARAQWVREDIERQGYIRALLGNQAGDCSNGVGPGEGGRRSMPPPPPLSSARISRCRGYSLRITGHSLGGGTGALLTYMMRRDYPSARCIAISPIGGLLNAPFAEQCGEFVLSAVFGKDMVPRLSVTSMERMRDEVLELIARSKVNKMTVMRSIVRGRFWGRRDSTTASPRGDMFGLVYSADEEVPRTGYYNQLRRYRDWVDTKQREWTFPELHAAGRFVHYVKTHKERRCLTSRWVFTPVWAAPTDFSEIEVSKRMFVDHFPTRTLPAFKETLKRLNREAEEAGATIQEASTAAGLENGGAGGSLNCVVGNNGGDAAPADELL